MGMIADFVLDEAFSKLRSETDAIAICSTDPADYDEMIASRLGWYSPLLLSEPMAGDTSGRKVHVDAIADISVTTTGTATHWALYNGSSFTLSATGPLAASYDVVAGDEFSLTGFDIEIRDPS